MKSNVKTTYISSLQLSEFLSKLSSPSSFWRSLGCLHRVWLCLMIVMDFWGTNSLIIITISIYKHHHLQHHHHYFHIITTHQYHPDRFSLIRELVTLPNVAIAVAKSSYFYRLKMGQRPKGPLSIDAFLIPYCFPRIKSKWKNNSNCVSVVRTSSIASYDKGSIKRISRPVGSRCLSVKTELTM